ncbi:M20 peptidase aminoacylase family protein [Virgibacillus sp. W0430]|uniref:M20 peptidase aminoacylase family protein n=1 Tax=Virgibacillus sp. W0430 TaxID=3391580 RepID=UPI003F44A3D9
MSFIERRVLETFDYLHENAEISWEETETTKYIASILQASNCEVETFDDCTGVIGKFGSFNKGLPVVAVRADIDALWQEVNGVFQANHSCGHDAHMSMVLGLLWKLQQNPALQEKVAIKFIFQPAEEDGTGALKMIEKQAIADVDYLFGIHLRPFQETKMGRATPVIVHGATRSIEAEIIGEDAHGARPHLNQNAVEIGAQIVTMLGKIHLDPRIPYSIKMTNFHAGGKSTNIIPGNGSFALDLRAQNNELMETLEKKVNFIFEAVRNLYDVEIKVTNSTGVAAAKIDEEAINIMQNAIKKVLGDENVDPALVTPGGDDFHFYTIKKPSLKATMVGLGCDLEPGLHHPHMSFNRDALMNGVAILYEAVLQPYNV